MKSKKLSSKELREQILQLSPKEFEKLVSLYNLENNQSINTTITDKYHIADLKLQQAGINKICPYCGSAIIVKRGKGDRKYQLFRCQDCNKTFHTASGTLLDGSSFSFEQWVHILGMTINGYSVADTVNVLVKDFGLNSVNESTVQLARHKIFHFVSLLPQPKLSGVIQVDETYFKENQKASNTLVNHIPNVVVERRPRYGKQPSVLGVMGSEFVNVPVAIDNTGHVVAKVACLGKMELPLFQTLFEEHFQSPAYICTDGQLVFGDYCRSKSIPHYVKPSTYLTLISKMGYDQATYLDDNQNKEVQANNIKILEKAYTSGYGDRIDFKGDLTFQQFYKLKRENKLSLGRVNQFHSTLKKFINTNKTGVSSKFLDKYVCFYAFLHNWKVDHGTFPSAVADFEEVLLYILKNAPHSTFTAKEYKKTTLKLPKPSTQYIQQLALTTSIARQEFNSKYLKFNEEDSVYNFKKREYLLDCPRTQIFQMAKENGLSPKGKTTQWEMVRQLIKLPNIDKIIVALLLKEKKIFIEDEDRDLLAHFKIDADTVKYDTEMEYFIKSHYPSVRSESPIFNDTTYPDPNRIEPPPKEELAIDDTDLPF